MSRPAIPTSVINKFVIANVRWRVDAEFELHRRYDELAGARGLGINLVVTARERYTRASSQVLLSRILRVIMCFVIRSTSVKKYCALLRPFTLSEKCDFTYLQGKYVKCSEAVRQADATCRTVYTSNILVQ